MHDKIIFPTILFIVIMLIIRIILPDNSADLSSENNRYDREAGSSKKWSGKSSALPLFYLHTPDSAIALTEPKILIKQSDVFITAAFYNFRTF